MAIKSRGMTIQQGLSWFLGQWGEKQTLGHPPTEQKPQLWTNCPAGVFHVSDPSLRPGHLFHEWGKEIQSPVEKHNEIQQETAS